MAVSPVECLRRAREGRAHIGEQSPNSAAIICVYSATGRMTRRLLKGSILWKVFDVRTQQDPFSLEFLACMHRNLEKLSTMTIGRP